MVNILDKIQVFVLYRNFGFINEQLSKEISNRFFGQVIISMKI
jgi:hypothetical protein